MLGGQVIWSGVFGGSEDPSNMSAEEVQEALNSSIKGNSEFIVKMAEVVNKMFGANIRTSDPPNEIAMQIIKSLPNGQTTFVNGNSDRQAQALKSFARGVSLALGKSGLISTDMTIDQIHINLSNLISALANGINLSATRAFSAVNNLVRHLKILAELQKHLENSLKESFSRMSAAEDQLLRNEKDAINMLMPKINESILSTISALEIQINGTMMQHSRANDRTINDIEALIDEIKKNKLADDKFTETVARTIATTGQLTSMSANLTAFLKNVNMPLKELRKIMDSAKEASDFIDKLQEKSSESSDKNAYILALANWQNKLKEIFSSYKTKPKEWNSRMDSLSVDVSGVPMAYGGAVELETEYSRKLREKFKRQEFIANQFVKLISEKYSEAISHLNFRSKIGRGVPVTDSLRHFAESLTLLKTFKMGTVYPALIGLSSSVQANQIHKDYMRTLQTMIDRTNDLLSAPEYSSVHDYLTKFSEKIKAVIEFIEAYRKQLEPEVRGGAFDADQAVSDLYKSVSAYANLNMKEITLVENAIDEFSYFIQMANVEEGFRSAAKVITENDDKYREMLAERVAAVIDAESIKIDEFIKFLKDEVENIPTLGALTAEQKQTMSETITFLEQKIKVMRNFMELVEAVDHNLRNTVKSLASNPSGVVAIKDILEALEMTAQWYGEDKYLEDAAEALEPSITKNKVGVFSSSFTNRPGVSTLSFADKVKALMYLSRFVTGNTNNYQPFNPDLGMTPDDSWRELATYSGMTTISTFSNPAVAGSDKQFQTGDIIRNLTNVIDTPLRFYHIWVYNTIKTFDYKRFKYNIEPIATNAMSKTVIERFMTGNISSGIDLLSKKIVPIPKVSDIFPPFNGKYYCSTGRNIHPDAPLDDLAGTALPVAGYVAHDIKAAAVNPSLSSFHEMQKVVIPGNTDDIYSLFYPMYAQVYYDLLRRCLNNGEKISDVLGLNGIPFDITGIDQSTNFSFINNLYKAVFYCLAAETFTRTENILPDYHPIPSSAVLGLLSYCINKHNPFIMSDIVNQIISLTPRAGFPYFNDTADLTVDIGLGPARIVLNILENNVDRNFLFKAYFMYVTMSVTNCTVCPSFEYLYDVIQYQKDFENFVKHIPLCTAVNFTSSKDDFIILKDIKQKMASIEDYSIAAILAYWAFRNRDEDLVKPALGTTADCETRSNQFVVDLRAAMTAYRVATAGSRAIDYYTALAIPAAEHVHHLFTCLKIDGDAWLTRYCSDEDTLGRLHDFMGICYNYGRGILRTKNELIKWRDDFRKHKVELPIFKELQQIKSDILLDLIVRDLANLASVPIPRPIAPYILAIADLPGSSLGELFNGDLAATQNIPTNYNTTLPTISIPYRNAITTILQHVLAPAKLNLAHTGINTIRDYTNRSIDKILDYHLNHSYNNTQLYPKLTTMLTLYKSYTNRLFTTTTHIQTFDCQLYRFLRNLIFASAAKRSDLNLAQFLDADLYTIVDQCYNNDFYINMPKMTNLAEITITNQHEFQLLTFATAMSKNKLSPTAIISSVNLGKYMQNIKGAYRSNAVLKNLVDCFIAISTDYKDTTQDYKGGAIMMNGMQIYERIINYLIFDSLTTRDKKEFMDAKSRLTAGTMTDAQFSPYRDQIIRIYTNPINKESNSMRKAFIMMLKGLVMKVFSVVDVNYIFNNPSASTRMTTTTRLLIGGSSDTPEVKDELLELYFRLPLLVELHSELFKFETGTHVQDSFRNMKERISMIPDIEGVYGDLVKFIFSRESIQDSPYTMEEITKIVGMINRIYDHRKSKVDKNITMGIIQDYINEINRRYGIIAENDKNLYMQERYLTNKDITVGTSDDPWFQSEPLVDTDDYIAPSAMYTKTTASSYDSNKFKLDKREFNASVPAALVAFREWINKYFSDTQAINTQGDSYNSLIENIKLEFNTLTSPQEKMNLIAKILQGGDMVNSMSYIKHVMFHETVVVNLTVLNHNAAIYEYINNILTKMEGAISTDFDSLLAGPNNLTNLLNKDYFVKDHDAYDFGGRAVIGIDNNNKFLTSHLDVISFGLTSLLRMDEQGAPKGIVVGESVTNRPLYNLYKYYSYDRVKMLKDLLSLIADAGSSTNGLITCDVSNGTPVFNMGKYVTNFTKVMSATYTYLNIFGRLFNGKLSSYLDKYENVNTPGSVNYIQRNFVEKYIEGLNYNSFSSSVTGSNIYSIKFINQRIARIYGFCLSPVQSKYCIDSTTFDSLYKIGEYPIKIVPESDKKAIKTIDIQRVFNDLINVPIRSENFSNLNYYKSSLFKPTNTVNYYTYGHNINLSDAVILGPTLNRVDLVSGALTNRPSVEDVQRANADYIDIFNSNINSKQVNSVLTIRSNSDVLSNVPQSNNYSDLYSFETDVKNMEESANTTTLVTMYNNILAKLIGCCYDSVQMKFPPTIINTLSSSHFNAGGTGKITIPDVLPNPYQYFVYSSTNLLTNSKSAKNIQPVREMNQMGIHSIIRRNESGVIESLQLANEKINDMVKFMINSPIDYNRLYSGQGFKNILNIPRWLLYNYTFANSIKFSRAAGAIIDVPNSKSQFRDILKDTSEELGVELALGEDKFMENLFNGILDTFPISHTSNEYLSFAKMFLNYFVYDYLQSTEVNNHHGINGENSSENQFRVVKSFFAPMNGDVTYRALTKEAVSAFESAWRANNIKDAFNNALDSMKEYLTGSGERTYNYKEFFVAPISSMVNSQEEVDIYQDDTGVKRLADITEYLKNLLPISYVLYKMGGFLPDMAANVFNRSSSEQDLGGLNFGNPAVPLDVTIQHLYGLEYKEQCDCSTLVKSLCGNIISPSTTSTDNKDFYDNMFETFAYSEEFKSKFSFNSMADSLAKFIGANMASPSVLSQNISYELFVEFYRFTKYMINNANNKISTLYKALRYDINNVSGKFTFSHNYYKHQLTTNTGLGYLVDVMIETILNSSTVQFFNKSNGDGIFNVLPVDRNLINNMDDDECQANVNLYMYGLGDRFSDLRPLKSITRINDGKSFDIPDISTADNLSPLNKVLLRLILINNILNPDANVIVPNYIPKVNVAARILHEAFNQFKFEDALDYVYSRLKPAMLNIEPHNYSLAQHNSPNVIHFENDQIERNDLSANYDNDNRKAKKKVDDYIKGYLSTDKLYDQITYSEDMLISACLGIVSLLTLNVDLLTSLNDIDKQWKNTNYVINQVFNFYASQILDGRYANMLCMRRFQYAVSKDTKSRQMLINIINKMKYKESDGENVHFNPFIIPVNQMYGTSGEVSDHLLHFINPDLYLQFEPAATKDRYGALKNYLPDGSGITSTSVNNLFNNSVRLNDLCTMNIIGADTDVNANASATVNNLTYKHINDLKMGLSSSVNYVSILPYALKNDGTKVSINRENFKNNTLWQNLSEDSTENDPAFERELNVAIQAHPIGANGIEDQSIIDARYTFNQLAYTIYRIPPELQTLSILQRLAHYSRFPFKPGYKTANNYRVYELATNLPNNCNVKLSTAILLGRNTGALATGNSAPDYDGDVLNFDHLLPVRILNLFQPSYITDSTKYRDYISIFSSYKLKSLLNLSDITVTSMDGATDFYNNLSSHISKNDYQTYQKNDNGKNSPINDASSILNFATCSNNSAAKRYNKSSLEAESSYFSKLTDTSFKDFVDRNVTHEATFNNYPYNNGESGPVLNKITKKKATMNSYDSYFRRYSGLISNKFTSLGILHKFYVQATFNHFNNYDGFNAFGALHTLPEPERILRGSTVMKGMMLYFDELIEKERKVNSTGGSSGLVLSVIPLAAQLMNENGSFKYSQNITTNDRTASKRRIKDICTKEFNNKSTFASHVYLNSNNYTLSKFLLFHIQLAFNTNIKNLREGFMHIDQFNKYNRVKTGLNPTIRDKFSVLNTPQSGAVLFNSLSDVIKSITTIKGDSDTTLNLLKFRADQISLLSPAAIESLAYNLPIIEKMLNILNTKVKFFKGLMDTPMVEPLLKYSTNMTNVGYGHFSNFTPSFAVNNSNSKSTFVSICENIESGINQLLSSINDMINEIPIKLEHFETKAEFNKQYQQINNHSPFAPISSLTAALNPEYYITNPYMMWPEKQIGTPTSQFKSACRALLTRYKSMQLSIPPLFNEILAKFNNSSLVKIPNEQFSELFSKTLDGMRASIDFMSYGMLMSSTSSPKLFYDLVKSKKHDDVHTYQLTQNMLIDVMALTNDGNVTAQMAKISKHVTKINSTMTGRKALILRNIVDLNIMPINLNVLERNIPGIYLFNYSYAFDRLVMELLQVTPENIKNILTQNFTNIETWPPKDILATLIIYPYHPLSQNVFTRQIGRIVRGDTGIDIGRPKLISDQLFPRVLGYSAYMSKEAFDYAPEYQSMSPEWDRWTGPVVHDRVERTHNNIDNVVMEKDPNDVGEEATKLTEMPGKSNRLNRFNKMYLVRDTMFLVFMQRIFLYKLSKELMQHTRVNVRSFAILDPKITDFSGNQMWTRDLSHKMSPHDLTNQRNHVYYP